MPSPIKWRPRASSKSNAEHQSEIEPFMSLEFQMAMASRIRRFEIRTENLRHHRQSRPPFFRAVTDHRAEVERGVFPFSVIGQFVVVPQLEADRPSFVERITESEAGLEFALGLVKVTRPLGGVSQVEGPFPFSVALADDDFFFQLGFIIRKARLDVQRQAERVFGGIQNEVSI